VSGANGQGRHGGEGQPREEAGAEDEALSAADALPPVAVEALKRVLRQRGVNQKRLAVLLGVTETTVSRWLNRSQGMPMGTLLRLADVLRVPVAALFAGVIAEGPHDIPPGLEALEQIVRSLEAMRAMLRGVPLHRLGAPGDPRRGQDDPGAAAAVGFAQIPLGTDRAVGPRGFAVQLEGDVDLGARGLQAGDVLYCNPDAPWGDGSLVVLGLSVDREGRPGPMAVRELFYGPGRVLDARTVPEDGPPEVASAGTYVVYGPVTALQAIAVLPEGRGHPRDPRRAGGSGPPGVEGPGVVYHNHTTRAAVPIAPE
jgi:transcriptional regulator with XRE-family HTH domain